MALQQNPNATGRIANLIYYTWRGIPCIRTMPNKVRQTKATKARAKDFGLAARYSAQWRAVFADLHPLPGDRQVMYRLNNIFMQWLRVPDQKERVKPENCEQLAGFEFNEKSRLKGRVKKYPVVDVSQKDKIVVTMPSLNPVSDIVAFTQTDKLRWTIVVAGINIAGRHENDPGLILPLTETFEMDYDRKILSARIIEFPVKFNKGDLIGVGVKLQYLVKEQKRYKALTEERWCPSAMIGLVCK